MLKSRALFFGRSLLSPESSNFRSIASCRGPHGTALNNSHIEPVSCQFEPSLCDQNTDIENWRPEIGARNSLDTAQNRESRAAETRQHLANSRECRDYFFKLDRTHRDQTGWLGRQDSNSQMSFSKGPVEMSGEFPRIPEHLGTRDFSRAICQQANMQPPAGLTA